MLRVLLQVRASEHRSRATQLEAATLRRFKFLPSHSFLLLVSRTRRSGRMARALQSARLHNCGLAGFMFLSSEEPSRNCHQRLAQRGCLRLAGIEPGSDLKKFSFLVRESRSRADSAILRKRLLK